MLMDVQKQTRLQVAHSLLAQYEGNRDAALQSVATTDETWVLDFTLETKRAVAASLITKQKKKQFFFFQRKKLSLHSFGI